MSSGVQVELVDNFDDERVSPVVWNRLLDAGSSPVCFLTWEWQRAWWDCFGRGQLMIAVVRRDGETVAIVPLYADSGMVFFVGSRGSDYLDAIGDVGDGFGDVLAAVAVATPGFVGCRFYHVPDWSPTAEAISKAAVERGLWAVDEGGLPAPVLAMKGNEHVVDKKSLVRHERWFAREGSLAVHHTSEGGEIALYLDGFFDQHVTRWADTPFPSLFLEPAQRAFYRGLVERAGESGWLRFTRIVWDDRDIAYHFGTSYGGRYLWYKPSFAIDLARHSPGEVLLRQLLLAAIDEGVREFDFGLGDEAFKQRFATSTRAVHTIGVYPVGLEQ